MLSVYKSSGYRLKLTQLTFVYTVLMPFNMTFGCFHFCYFQFIQK